MSEEKASADPHKDGLTIEPGSWAAWARRVAAIARTGLAYTEGVFDRERYEELQEIAAGMLAACGGGSPAEVARGLELEDGYPTPKVDVRAAVFADNQILLVRERDDDLWSLPGGWADGGDTPAECAVREVREESGYQVRVTKLAAVWDRDREGHPPLQWHVYKLFFLCELEGGSASASVETSEVGFFPVTDLPPMSEGRVLATQVARLLEHQERPELPTDFN